MKHPRYTLIFLLASTSLLLISCTDKPHIKAVLDKAEEVMETEDPAVVRTMLNSINTEELNTRRLKARYALLYSQVLDKNYIDLTSDSIISPAVRYYRHHGSAEDKLKTLYYLGTIKKNAGDNEGAMRCYIEAERYVPRNENLLMSGRLYSAKKALNYNLMLFDGALHDAIKAAEYFKSANDYYRHSKELINAANISLILRDTINSQKYLDSLHNLIPYMSESSKGQYYGIRLDAVHEDSTKLLSSILYEYLSQISHDDIDWLSVAQAYFYINQPDSALVAARLYAERNIHHSNEQRYNLTMAMIYQTLKNYKLANDYWNLYTDLEFKKTFAIIHDDTKYTEERLRAQLKHTQLLLLLMLSSITIAAICLIAASLIKRNKKRIKQTKSANLSLAKRNMALEEAKLNLQEKNASLQNEYNKLLSELINSSTDNEVLRKQVEEGMSTFHKLIAYYISHKNISKSVETELNHIIENKEQLLSGLMSYTSTMYPEFSKYLKEHDLSEQEIDICNLYVLGLLGKEIGNYLNLSRHYNISSDIRKKLGLTEHDTNIGIYLRQLRDRLR